MAEEKAEQKKKPRIRKSPETVRERAEKETAKREKPTKRSKVKGRIYRPLSTLRRVGSKEYHPIKVPEKKGVRHLNKRVRIVPKFVRESWAELKLVTWPSKKEAARLTGAVIVFALFFAIFIQILDVFFNKIVKEIFVK